MTTLPRSIIDRAAPLLASRSEAVTVAEWLDSPDAPEYSELFQGMLYTGGRLNSAGGVTCDGVAAWNGIR